ncbi:MAG TPA: hypothetical protein VIJ46_00955 [Rhabdochlamydiaceae bacterium]
MNDYQKLVSDTARFLKENYAPGDSLLVPSRAPAPPPPAPVQKKQTYIPPPKSEAPLAAQKKVEEAPPPQPLPVREPLHLQPLEAPLIEKAEALRELLAKVAPDFALKETPPDDTGAQRIRNHWKEEMQAAAVVILSFGETEKELLFYKNIAQAINQSLLPAKLVDGRRLEKEKKWDSFLESSQLKWILISQDQLKKGMDLLRHFRENPATSEKFLGQASLLLIAPPATHFKQPGLKRTLWETLCTRLSS